MFAKPVKKETGRANSGGTATWLQSTEKNKRIMKFRDSLVSTKHTSENINVYEATKVPELDEEEQEMFEEMDEDQKLEFQAQIDNEWVAENLVDLYQEICLLFNLFQYKNTEWAGLMKTPEKLPNNGFPEGVQYKWKTSSHEPPQAVSLEEYVAFVNEWIEKQMANEDLFPTNADVPFRIDFAKRHAKKMFQRMFRIYAIMLVNPALSGIDRDNENENTKNLLRSFQRFLCFTFTWDLVDNRELSCIEEFAVPVRKKYDKAKREYLKRSK